MAAPRGNSNARKGTHGRLIVGVSGELLDRVYASLAGEGKLDPDNDEVRAIVLGTLERAYGMKKEKQAMHYSSEKDVYTGVTSTGRTIQVEGIEYAESEQDGVEEEVLNDPDMWAGLVGANQNVEYVD